MRPGPKKRLSPRVFGAEMNSIFINKLLFSAALLPVAESNRCLVEPQDVFPSEIRLATVTILFPVVVVMAGMSGASLWTWEAPSTS